GGRPGRRGGPVLLRPGAPVRAPDAQRSVAGRCHLVAVAFISRGFRGKKRDTASSSRVPPGQHTVNDFPVLSAGPTPRVDLAKWTFTINGEIDQPKTWAWDEFKSLPTEDITVDIHCVTKWSKL